jgi:hypothetical protein
MWTNSEKMNQLDCQARREAGRKVLQSAGSLTVELEDIEQALASPPTKVNRGPAPEVVEPIDLVGQDQACGEF